MEELRSDVAAADGQVAILGANPNPNPNPNPSPNSNPEPNQVASLGAQLADSQSQQAELHAQLEAISGVATGRRLSQGGGGGGGGSPGFAMRTASSPSAGGREEREVCHTPHKARTPD